MFKVTDLMIRVAPANERGNMDAECVCTHGCTDQCTCTCSPRTDAMLNGGAADFDQAALSELRAALHDQLAQAQPRSVPAG